LFTLVTTDPAPIVDPLPMVTPGLRREWNRISKFPCSCEYATMQSSAFDLQNNHAPPKPTILPNVNLLPKFRPLEPVPYRWIRCMSGSVERDVWSKQRARADVHSTAIEDGTVEVDVDLLAEVDVVAVVGVKGGFDIRFIGEENVIVDFRGWRGERGRIVADASVCRVDISALEVPL
jgi:hypothetical protein